MPEVVEVAPNRRFDRGQAAKQHPLPPHCVVDPVLKTAIGPAPHQGTGPIDAKSRTSIGEASYGDECLVTPP